MKAINNIFNRLCIKVGGLLNRPDAVRSKTQPASFQSLLNEYGVLKSSATLTVEEKRTVSIWFDFKERAEVAMIVAQFYPGGDYFEFGSEGTGTLRNFLTAFDLTGRISAFPDTRFYAFDIFGDMTGAVMTTRTSKAGAIATTTATNQRKTTSNSTAFSKIR